MDACLNIIMEKKINDIITNIENNMKLPLSMSYTYSNILKVIEKLNNYEVILFFGNNTKSILSIMLAIFSRGFLKNTALLSNNISNHNLIYYVLSAVSSIPLSKLKTGKLNTHEFASLLKFSDTILNNNVSIEYLPEIDILNENITDYEKYSAYKNIFLIEKKLKHNLDENEIIKKINIRIENIFKHKNKDQKILFNISYEKNIFTEIINSSKINSKKISLIINLNKTFLNYIKKYITNFSENILIKELTNTDKITNTYLFTNFDNLNSIINF